MCFKKKGHETPAAGKVRVRAATCLGEQLERAAQHPRVRADIALQTTAISCTDVWDGRLPCVQRTSGGSSLSFCFFLYFLNLSLGIVPLHPSQARLILGSTPGGTRVRIHCACTSKRCMPLDSRHSMWQLISRLQTRCSKNEEKEGRRIIFSRYRGCYLRTPRQAYCTETPRMLPTKYTHWSWGTFFAQTAQRKDG